MTFQQFDPNDPIPVTPTCYRVTMTVELLHGDIEADIAEVAVVATAAMSYAMSETIKSLVMNAIQMACLNVGVTEADGELAVRTRIRVDRKAMDAKQCDEAFNAVRDKISDQKH